uniref:Uncharacterized protein n=1 Tax=Oryza brachyantha TaxID=4533 RepID=J3M3V4_ORYBR
MASSGFEGFEKRLELVFTLPVGGGGVQHGLRLMPVEALREVLDEAQCTVVSAAGNAAFDAYVLSESSLFVYPGRVVLKTCGTTRLLRACQRIKSRFVLLAASYIWFRVFDIAHKIDTTPLAIDLIERSGHPVCYRAHRKIWTP